MINYISPVQSGSQPKKGIKRSCPTLDRYRYVPDHIKDILYYIHIDNITQIGFFNKRS